MTNEETDFDFDDEPSRWGRLAKFLVVAAVLGGVIVRMVLNVIRIITLFLTRLHWPKAFDIMHVDVWQVMFILFAILLWALWASWTTKRMQSPAHAPN